MRRFERCDPGSIPGRLITQGDSMAYSTVLEEDDHGDLVLTLPDEIVKHFNLVEGDIVNFNVQDESIVLTFTKK